MSRLLHDDGVMFSPADRDRLRDTLVRQAQRDPRIVSAAVVGSAARSAEDHWSDIDLALRIGPGVAIEDASETWTEWLGSVVDIVDSLDVSAFGGLYRVFLLENSLQVDLSFFPFDEFRATNGEPFQLLFGDALPAEATRPRDWLPVARMGWLYLLHARSALGRDHLWQAELMLSDVRATVLSLAAQRHGLRAAHGRDAHRLSREITDALARARAIDIERDELLRSLHSMAGCFLQEVAEWDSDYRDRLEPTLLEIGSTAEADT